MENVTATVSTPSAMTPADNRQAYRGISVAPYSFLSERALAILPFAICADCLTIIISRRLL